MAQSKLTIQVQIGNRSYPLTVPAEEQEVVIKAAEKINHELKVFEQTYQVKDQQDLLAMFSLQLASEQLKTSDNDSVAIQGLKQLNQMITDHLAKK